MEKQSAILVAWLGSLVVIALLAAGIARMVGRKHGHRHRTSRNRRVPRWLLVPGFIVLGVYAMRFGVPRGSGRPYELVVLLVLLAGLAFVVLASGNQHLVSSKRDGEGGHSTTGTGDASERDRQA